MCAEIGHQETADRRCNKTHYEPWSILVSATICILAGDTCSHRLPIFVLRKNTFVSTLKFWMGLKKLEKFPMLKIGKPSDVSKSLEKSFDVGNRKS